MSASFGRVRVGREFVVVLMLLAFVAMAAPVRADPPQALNFATTVIYDIRQGPPSVAGSWSASGLVNSGGDAWIDHFNAGWNDAGLWLRSSHTTEVYSDQYGTITVRAQLTNISGFSPFHGDGHWTIKGGTGAYSGLKGQGTVSVRGELLAFPYLTVEATYSGVGHYDGQ